MDEWVCGKCRSVNLKFATSCYSCATPRRVAEAAFSGAGGGTLQPSLSTPQAPLTGSIQAASGDYAAASGGYAAALNPVATTSAPTVGSSGLLGGLALGLIAAIGATAVWYGVVAYSGWQVGVVAVAVGWLVGTGSVVGARGGVSFLLVVSSVLFTLGALAVSEYLIIAQLFSTEFGIGLGELAISPFEVVFESISADPLTLVFWAIALFIAASVPFRALTGNE